MHCLKKTALMLEKKMPFVPKGTLLKIVNENIGGIFAGIGSNVNAMLGIIMEIVTNLVLIPFVAFFLLKDGRSIKKSMIAFVPNKYFETFLCLLYEVNRQITNYIRGQLIDAFIVGFLAVIGLYMAGIKYAIVIGIIAGAANVIPFVGPLIGIVVGSIAVLIDTGSGVGVLKVLGVFAVVKLLDDVVIAPLAVGKSVDVHPMMVIIAILVGGFFMGVLGMLLAVPLYCTMKVSSQILYKGLVEYGEW
mgnify:CR=1 FL=1